MPSITLTLRTEEEIRDKLDRTAEALGRNRNWCMNEAIQHYLDLHQWQIDHIRKGIAATDAGRTFSTEEVIMHIEKREEQRNGN